MSEDLTEYLLEHGFRVRYLHSEVDTIERIQIIRDLRLGEYDVLVGVNLLREGLDIPEVGAGRDPRRRQGGVPARLDQPDPDDRAGGAERRRQGADVRRPRERGDADRDRRDRPPPRDPGRLQRGARDHRRDGHQGHQRHVRLPRDGVERAAQAPPRQQGAARRPRDREPRGPREGDRLDRGGDARRRRGAALRGGRAGCATSSRSSAAISRACGPDGVGARCSASSARSRPKRPRRGPLP